jgi:hypothetical protein
MLQRGMERIRTAGGSLTTIAAAIPSIAGIGIAVQFSEFIRRNISESGRWKLIHRFTNIGVGGFASLIAVDHIRRLRRLPTSAKERLDQELQLAITALEVTEVSTFSGFRDLVGLDGDRLANVNLPGSDPEIDNGLERMIQRLSLTETYVQDINEIYTREFGY